MSVFSPKSIDKENISFFLSRTKKPAVTLPEFSIDYNKNQIRSVNNKLFDIKKQLKIMEKQ